MFLKLLFSLLFTQLALADYNIHDADQYVMHFDSDTGEWAALPFQGEAHTFFGKPARNNFSPDQLFYYGLSKIILHGKIYPLPGPGLYRAVDSLSLSQNLIVMPTKDSVDDPRKLWLYALQGLAGLHIHGLKHEELLNTARYNVEHVTKTIIPLAYFESTCGATAYGAMAFLENQLGFSEGQDMRIVRISTDHNLNTYSNGHTIFELKDPNTNHWVLVDEDLGFLFKDPKTHQLLSAFETWQHFNKNQEIEFSHIINSHYTAASSITFNRKEEAGLNFAIFANMDLIKSWYKRVFVLLAIDHVACGKQSFWENLYGNLPYDYLEPAAFYKRHYQ